LEGINLQQAKLRQANLGWARLKRADLRFADLEGANLEQAVLNGARLQGAKLAGARLRRARLKGADLRKASLRGADLTWAELPEADLGGADLDSADLNRANLAAANARGADFQKAKGLDKANLKGLIIDSKTRFWGVDAASIRPWYPVLARAIMDAQFVEDFENQHPRIAWVWWLVSDYGRSLLRWALCSLVIALTLGLIFTFLFPGSFELRPGREATWFTYFYFSIVTFTTLGFGDVVPKDLLGEILLSLEVVLGYVMLGGLVSILATKLARRS